MVKGTVNIKSCLCEDNSIRIQNIKPLHTNCEPDSNQRDHRGRYRAPFSTIKLLGLVDQQTSYHTSMTWANKPSGSGTTSFLQRRIFLKTSIKFVLTNSKRCNRIFKLVVLQDCKIHKCL